MEKSGHETGIPGSRQSDLKGSFKSVVRSLLTACSKQDFLDIFSKFSGAEQELLFRLYTQVVVNLHQTLEDEFDEQCHETQLVEEQNLDPLFSNKTDVMEIANDLTTAKKKEIQKLTGLLQRAEEQNRQMEARISLLRKQAQEVSGTAERIEEVVVNLHQTLEDEFDEQCHETQVGPILDTVEQLVEEQNLDPLFSNKTDVMEIANDLTTAKKNEIQKLTGLLQRAEEQNRQMEARINLLRKQTQEVSGTAERIEKLKARISGYFEGNDKLPPI